MKVKDLIGKKNVFGDDPGSVESAASSSADSEYLPEEDQIQPTEENFSSKELSLILTSGADQKVPTYFQGF
jgi:hypothetical protein